MTEEILDRLRRIQHRASALGGLVADLQALVPHGADGWDQTGQVQVSIGPDGLPFRIRVEPGWQNQLRPEALAPAVQEAFTAAVAAGMQTWSQALDRASWPSRVAEFEARAGQSDAGSSPASPPPSAEASSGGRDSQEVAEEVLRASAQVRKQSSDAARTATGTDQSGNVTITLSPAGLQACSIAAAWASRQEGGVLTTALNLALRQARDQLDATVGQPAAGSLQDLAAEALAALERLAGTVEKDGR